MLFDECRGMFHSTQHLSESGLVPRHTRANLIHKLLHLALPSVNAHHVLEMASRLIIFTSSIMIKLWRRCLTSAVTKSASLIELSSYRNLTGKSSRSMNAVALSLITVTSFLVSCHHLIKCPQVKLIIFSKFTILWT